MEKDENTLEKELEHCALCPNECGVNRKNGETGKCGVNGIKVALFMLHKFEEPCISLDKGSGAIFFSGCPMSCCYCQNYKISQQLNGETLTESEFIDRAVELASGADNLNLVSAGHLLPDLIEPLKIIKKRISVPIVYNTSGFEKAEAIASLSGIVDVFLPDFKYAEDELGEKLSGVKNYSSVATKAINEMLKISPEPIFDEKGKMLKGVIIRHLVLSGYRKNSLMVLDHLKANFKGFLLSLMSQYCPDFYFGTDKNLKRRVTTFEYNSALNHAVDLGLAGYMQEKMSAKKEYCPF